MRLILVILLAFSLSAEGSKNKAVRRCFDALVELRRDPTFLPLRKDLPFLRENWALDASGADLMREHPAVTNADYANNKVAVIDTGLALSGNPHAGPALLTVSPELDYDVHGTGVVGVVASQRYGVNPRLQVLPVPVRYREPTYKFFTGRAGGFDSVSLQEKWREVLNDPAVSVINLSMTENVPEVEDYVKEALAKGKWVVYAAGNSGSVNDSSSAAMSEFNGQPGFFVSGGLSYLAAPASFSHYGPGVKFYSPGSSVETLHGDYNPRIAGSVPNTAYDGTSFSAPHLSAVLATMRAIRPKLSPQHAEWILEQTAIKRGKVGECLQVNPLHAIELLTQANQLEGNGACRTPMACYKAARRKIAQEVMRLSPVPPLSQDRGAWLAYYHDLRRGYFLSNADCAFAKPLREMLIALGRESAAEAVYYAARGDDKPLQALAPEGNNLREEYARAIAALAKPSPAAEAQNLSDIPTVPENVDLFLDLAGDYFEAGGTDPKGVARCLSHARRPFLVALVKKLLARRRPLATIAPLHYFKKVATTDDDKALLQKLTARTLAGWKVRADVKVLGSLLSLLSELTPEQRLELLNDFEAKRAANALTSLYNDGYDLTEANFDRLDARLRVWQADLRGQEARIRAYQGPPNVSEEWDGILDFGFAAARFRAGHHTAEQLARGFESLFTARRKQSDIVYYNKRGALTVNYHFAIAAFNREGCDALTGVLLRDDNLTLLGTMIDLNGAIVRLLRKASPEVRRDLIAATIKTLKNTTVRSQNELAKALFAERELPEVRAFIDELLSARQSTPELQQLRLNFLFYSAIADGAILSGHGRRYLEESELGQKRIFIELPFTQVVNDPELLGEILAQLRDPRRLGPDPSNTVQWMLSGTQKDFEKVQSELAKNLAAIWRASPIVTPEETARLGTVFAASAGDNAAIVKTVMKQAEILLADRDYCQRPSNDKAPHASPSRDHGVVMMLLQLSSGVEGARQLAKNKALLQRMAEIIRRDDEITFFRRSDTVFPPLAELFRSELPTLDVMLAQDYAPPWMAVTLISDPRHLDLVLGYLKDPRVRANSGFRSQMAAVLLEMLSRYPTLLPVVRDFVRANPDEDLVAILVYLGYAP